MKKTLGNQLRRFKPLRFVISLSHKIVLPGLHGLSLHTFIKTYFKGMGQGAFSARAGSIAFSFFMAIFPALLFLLNLIPYVPIEGFDDKFLGFIYELMPTQSEGFFKPIINDIFLNQRAGLLSFTGVLALILMANGVNAIFSGFEKSFHQEINRGFVKKYLVALGVSIILALILVTTTVVIIYFEYLLNTLRENNLVGNRADIVLLGIESLLFFIVMIYAVIATLYFFGTKSIKKTKFFSAGALMTTVLIMLTTYAFGIYIDNFSTYNELYGSIGALLIMMLYIWLNSNLLLLGSELNTLLNKLRQSKRDES